ncbi:MAG: DUF6537 domain-containing protein [Acidimicrobiales bacterium]
MAATELSAEVEKQLFHVMAYKDEYEVARLALNSDIVEQARARFGPNAKVSFQLKPPVTKKLSATTKRLPSRRRRPERCLKG